MSSASAQPASEQALYEPAIQTLGAEPLRTLQEERLARQIRRIFTEPVPLFRRHLEAAGIRDPRDVAGTADLARIPPLKKSDLRASEAAAPPFGDYRGSQPASWVRIGQTTGSSGRPTLIVWTRRDLEIDYRAAARARWRWGLRPGMVFAQAHPHGLYAGGWHMSHGVEFMGCLDIPSGPPATSEHREKVVRLWQRVQPDMYRLFGNAGVKYYETAVEMGLDPARDLRFQQAGSHPASQFEAVSAGLEALGMLGSACAEKNGAHLCEDLAIVEVVDRRTGRAVGHGERGNLIVTILEKDNFHIRYDLEDLVRLNLDPCSCGETHRRMFYDGRVSDAVPVAPDGPNGRIVEMLPIDAALLLHEFPELAIPSVEYQLVRRPRPGSALELRVEGPVGAGGDLVGAIARRARDRFGVAVDIELVSRGGLPRFDFKAARVVDEVE